MISTAELAEDTMTNSTGMTNSSEVSCVKVDGMLSAPVLINKAHGDSVDSDPVSVGEVH